MINFDALSDQVYHRADGTVPQREDQNRLWQAFFAQPEWLFLVDASQPLSDQTRPFIGYLDDQPWFFVFTDSTHALELAKRWELTDKAGNCLYITMPTEAIFKFLESAKGSVQGIRVNEGPHGWFAPIENVFAIYNYLNSQTSN